jgi:hypothetical protein
MSKAFEPLAYEGHVWVKAKLLLAGLILMEDSKASTSSLGRLAADEGWETQKIGIETYYLIPERQLETRLGLEKITVHDFDANGDLTRLMSKTVLVNTLGHQMTNNWQAQVETLQASERQLRHEWASTEHHNKLLLDETLEKQAKIDTLNRKLIEAEHELRKMDTLRVTLATMETVVKAQAGVIDRLPGREVIDPLVVMVAKQGESLDRLMTKAADALRTDDKTLVADIEVIKPDDYQLQIDAAFALAVERVTPRPRRLFGNKRLRFGHRVDTGNAVCLDLDDYADSGERDAILASSGMGKSYLMGVLMEETLECKKHLLVFDPEGEHHTLSSLYPVVVVGGDKADLPLPDANTVGLLLAAFYMQPVGLVLDLCDLVPSEKQALFAMVGRALMQASQAHKVYTRVVVDECHLFAPQSGGVAKGDDTSLRVAQDIASLGRKRGLHSVWASQRPAKVHNDVLSQCNRFWVGGIKLGADFNGVKAFVDDMGVTHDHLKALTRGQFYLGDLGEVALITSRKRFCVHGGATPGSETIDTKEKPLETPATLPVTPFNRVVGMVSGVAKKMMGVLL